jgi:hypothetical protein
MIHLYFLVKKKKLKFIGSNIFNESSLINNDIKEFYYNRYIKIFGFHKNNKKESKFIIWELENYNSNYYNIYNNEKNYYEKEYKDDKLNGKSIHIKFQINSSLLIYKNYHIYCNYKDDNKNGVFEKYYQNGECLFKTNYVNDK